MQGGGSGKVVEPGDPDGSTLLLVVMHKEEPKMPPNSPKLPDAEIDVIRADRQEARRELGGCGGGQGAAVFRVPAFILGGDGKLAGPPGMPESFSTEPFVPQAAKPGRCRMMAASPWAFRSVADRRPQEKTLSSIDDRLPPRRRAALPRGPDLHLEVQPQRRPAAAAGGAKRLGPNLRRRLGRQACGTRVSRGRQGIRHRAGRRHQPRPAGLACSAA